jgi:RsiW-degrading membrane proteinase PrsW (M82 family)
MLQSLLLYLGDTQREGQLVTRRVKSTILLWTLASVFFLIAFVAAFIGGAIYLADEIGAGPAALVIAGGAFLLGIFMLVALAIKRRPRVYATAPVMPLAAAPLAAQSLAGSALAARPFVTLLTAIAVGYVATRTTILKKK